MKLSEVVKRVIDLAGKVYDYYTAELPKFYKNYPLVNPGRAIHRHRRRKWNWSGSSGRCPRTYSTSSF